MRSDEDVVRSSQSSKDLDVNTVSISFFSPRREKWCFNNRAEDQESQFDAPLRLPSSS